MTKQVLKQRKPWLAALLSFVTTGLGQLYNGQWKKAVLFFGLETMLGLGVVMAMGTMPGLIGGILFLLCFNVFVAGEAYRTAKRARNYTLKPTNNWWVYAILIVANLAAGTSVDVFAASSFFKTFKVPSGSMKQTLQVGDHFMAEILGINTPISRGDIVVFKNPDTDAYFVKRVVGLPGEGVAIQSKSLLINGAPQKEPYSQHTKQAHKPIRDMLAPQKLGPDEYFLMGDNREASYDSRWLGPIKREAIYARAKYLYFPSDFGGEKWFARLGKPVR